MLEDEGHRSPLYDLSAALIVCSFVAGAVHFHGSASAQREA